VNKTTIIAIIILAFFAGFFANQEKIMPETEMPYPGILSTGMAPGNWVEQNRIRVYPHYIRIDFKNAKWANFTNTNSMIPVLSSKSNAIQVKPSSKDQLKIGDIISFRTQETKTRIIHRIIGIGQDEKGRYYITKGDNNKNEDPFKVRFKDIERVVVAVVY